MQDFVKTDSDSGGVHANCGILNKAAYLLSEGGSFGGVDVGQGIGRAALGKVYMRVIHELPHTGAVGFSDFRQRVVTAAGSESGANTAKKAFDAVGING
jgi:thermolysin